MTKYWSFCFLDGCFEIKENFAPNSGKDPHQLMMKKSKLKRYFKDLVKMPGGLDPNDLAKNVEDDDMGPMDLLIGTLLNPNNSPLCNNFTF